MRTGAANQRHTDGIHHPDTTAPTATPTRSPQPEGSGRARKSWGNKIRQFTPDKLKQLFTSRHSDDAGPSSSARTTVGAAVGTAKTGLTRLDAQLKAEYQSARPATQESEAQGTNRSRQARDTQTQELLESRFTDPRTGHAIAVKSGIDEQGRKWKIFHDQTADIVTIQTKTKWEQTPNNANKMVRTVTIEEADGKKTRRKEILDALTGKIERTPAKTKTKWEQTPNDANKMVRTVTIEEADGKKTRRKEILDALTGKIERTPAKTKTKWEQDPNDRNKMVRTVTIEEADGKKTRWKEILDVLTGSTEQKPFSPVRFANTTGASTSASHRSAQSGTPPESSARSPRQNPARTGNSRRARFNGNDSTELRETPWQTVDEKTGRKERTFHRPSETRPVKTEAKWTDRDGDWTETYNHETGVREASTAWKPYPEDEGTSFRKLWKVENGIREEWTEIHVEFDSQTRIRDLRRFRVDDPGTGDTRGRRNATGTGATNAHARTGARGPEGAQEPRERPRGRQNATGTGAENARGSTGTRGPAGAQGPREKPALAEKDIREIRRQRVAALALLGLEPTAQKEQVNSAYKQMALKVHPDKNGNTKESEEKFKEIGNAKDFLMEDENWV